MHPCALFRLTHLAPGALLPRRPGAQSGSASLYERYQPGYDRLLGEELPDTSDPADGRFWKAGVAQGVTTNPYRKRLALSGAPRGLGADGGWRVYAGGGWVGGYPRSGSRSSSWGGQMAVLRTLCPPTAICRCIACRFKCATFCLAGSQTMPLALPL